MGKIAQERLEYNQHQHPLENCPIQPHTLHQTVALFCQPKTKCVHGQCFSEKKNLNLFFSIKKINRKSHILCVVFFQLLLGIGNFNLPMS